MAKDFYAFRVNPESDADIIIMMENADNKTEFVKACIRVARDHVIACSKTIYPLTNDEAYIKSSMEV